MVTASAPGKVILAGEHAVVHGVPAIAAALSQMRIYVQVDLTNSGFLEVQLPDLDITAMIEIRELVNIVYSTNNFDTDMFPDPNKVSPDIVQHLDSYIKSHLQLSGAKESNSVVLVPLVFLVIYLVPQAQGLRLVGCADHLPTSAGLGSSASFSVASSATLLYQRQKILGFPVVDITTDLDPQFLQAVNQWAEAADRIIHGRVSGVDNTISCFGGIVYFEKKAQPPSIFRQIQTNISLKLLITHTRHPRATKNLVQKVYEKLESFPSVTRPIFESIHGIVDNICLALQTGETESIGPMFTTNHHLLNALGVGHPLLDKILSITEKKGFHTKLTGAGGGGCTITLLPTNTDSESKHSHVLNEIIEELEKLGFDCFITDIGGHGVILSPGSLPKHLKKSYSWKLIVRKTRKFLSSLPVLSVVGSVIVGATVFRLTKLKR